MIVRLVNPNTLKSVDKKFKTKKEALDFIGDGSRGIYKGVGNLLSIQKFSKGYLVLKK